MSQITIKPRIEEAWRKQLSKEFQADYFQDLKRRLVREYEKHTVFPKKKDLFKAYDLCPFDSVKVVILGQDPYHGLGQAHGLCFSVPENTPFPPSLRNIFKEIHADLRLPIPQKGDLSYWAQQGVFLLNTYLSVREASPLSHSKLGWERFTDASISALSKERKGIVFLLWGSNARKKKALINSQQHHILESVHPSPLSAHRGFFGCQHFSKTNDLLRSMGKTEIDWEIK